MMYRKFISIILASAVAVTGFASVPARADEKDVLKILGGIAAIAVIGSAIKDYNDRNDNVARGYNYNNKNFYRNKHNNKHYYKKKHSKKKHYHKHDRRAEDRYHYQHGDRHRTRNARPLPNRVQRKLLPASCRVQARNKNGTFVGFTDWCLKRKYGFARSLPRNCASKARILSNRNRNIVYSNRCLARHGFVAGGY